MHMQRSVKVIAGVFPPVMFLTAQTSGCIWYQENVEDCECLATANFIATTQFTMSGLTYLGTAICQQHITFEDKFALHDNEGYVFKWLLQALTWAIALGAFGARPRDIESGNEPEEQKMARILTGVGYVHVGVWFLLLAWEYFHLKHKILVDHQRSRMLSEASEASDVRTSLFERLWNCLSEFTSRHEVNDQEPRTSPLFRQLACATSWMCALPKLVSPLLLLGRRGKDASELAIAASSSFKPIFALSIVAYSFLDLRDEGPDYARSWY
jgi:hypothetical protein